MDTIMNAGGNPVVRTAAICVVGALAVSAAAYGIYRWWNAEPKVKAEANAEAGAEQAKAA